MIEEQRVGLVYGFRALDVDIVFATGGGDGSHHGDAMVVVGIDRAADQLGDAVDDERVAFDLDLRSQVAKFFGDGGEPIGFFDAQASAVGDHRAALCNGGDRGDNGDQIRDVLGTHLEAAEFVWTRNGGVGGAAYAGTKARQGCENVAIALGGRKREPVDLDGQPAQSACAQPEGRIGPVTLYGRLMRGAVGVVLGGEDGDLCAIARGPAINVDVDSEGLHGLYGEVDIGPALDAPVHNDLAGVVEQRCCEQKAGNVLRTHIAGKLESSRANSTRCFEWEAAETLEFASGGD